MDVFILDTFKIFLLCAVFLLLNIKCFLIGIQIYFRNYNMYRSHAISMCGNCHLNNQINELPKFNKSRVTSLWFYFNTSLKELHVMGMASRLTQMWGLI